MAAKGKRSKPAAELTKPRLFIGSSAEAAKVALHLQSALSHSFEAEPWTALGVFGPSRRPADSLLSVLGRSQFGVFLFTPDDVVFSRGKSQAAVRDNVLIEVGMAIGRLGVDRSFLVMPAGLAMKLPSDLAGVEPIRYDSKQFDSNPSVAISPVATAIGVAAAVASAQSHPATSAIADLAAKLSTLLGPLATWRAGVKLSPPPPDKFAWWAENVLSAADDSCRRLLPSIPPDAYVAWMLPTRKGEYKGKLGVTYAHNLPANYSHFSFAKGEGVAGTAWDNGESIIHTRDMPSPAWKMRKGCENTTYLCVPIGMKGGSGGVLAVGSDTGFRPTSDLMVVLKMFASVLAVATG